MGWIGAKLAWIGFQGALAGVGLALAFHFATILATPNLHTVIPGKVYRAAQPSETTLRRLAQQYGVRTVINLRGCCPHLDWYQQESANTARLDLDQIDISMSAARVPSPESIRQLIEALDEASHPVLLHCQQGVDRTGLASALALLLYTDTPLAQARRQMSLEMGHVRLGRTRFIGRFFDYYAQWLEEAGVAHSPEYFRLWATHHYCPGEARTQWEYLGKGKTFPKLQETMLKMRVINRSIRPWQFTPGRNTGIHGYWYLENEAGERAVAGQVGFFERTVPPGEAVELNIALPPLAPGRYLLLLELMDEQHASFLQLGDDAFLLELMIF
jgi:protein tyrosine phosphatase (PTP) superfamily phosphohydrolase (DUF442 family)